MIFPDFCLCFFAVNRQLTGWRNEQNKPLALPYANAVHDMIPTTKLATGDGTQHGHESINDLPVHSLTGPQIFYPVSESREFTRVDAGRVFSAAPALPSSESNKPTNPAEEIINISTNHGKIERVGKGDSEHDILLPADVRIPHPHLVAFEHDKLGARQEARKTGNSFVSRLRTLDKSDIARAERQKQRAEKNTTKVESDNGRYEFRFRDVEVSREVTGRDGRGVKAPGRRYGVPSYERKRGTVKIPTKVEV